MLNILVLAVVIALSLFGGVAVAFHHLMKNDSDFAELAGLLFASAVILFVGWVFGWTVWGVMRLLGGV